MNKPAAVVALALLALGVTSWFLVPSAQQAADQVVPEVVRERVTERHDERSVLRRERVPEHTNADEPQERRAPNGMPLLDGEKEAGFPKVEQRRPLDSPGDWVGVRAEAHQQWVKKSMDALDFYADRERLSDGQYERLQATFGELHSTVEQTRQALEAGTMHPIEGRAEMTAARETAAAEVAEMFGDEEMHMMRLEMVKRVPGGAF